MYSTLNTRLGVVLMTVLMVTVVAGIASKPTSQLGANTVESESPQVAREAQAGDILDILASQDSQLCSTGFGASYEMRIPSHPFDPKQSLEIMAAELTCDNASRAIYTVSGYDAAPMYRPPVQDDQNALDYDDLGNYLLWRTDEKSVLSAPDLNDTRAATQVFEVSPDGAVTPGALHVQSFLYAIGSDENLYEFDHFLFCVGRGFSQHLALLVSSTPLGEGLIEVVATGSYGSGFTGTWVLIVDENADFLVRSAAFTEDEHNETVLTVSSLGALSSNGLSIGESGQITFDRVIAPDYVVEVVVTSFQGTTDAQLLTDVRDNVTALLANGDEIVDYRVEPPTRSYVGEGG